MRLKKFFAAFLLCAALVLGLTACAGKSYTYTLNYADLRMSVGQEQQLTVTVDPGKEFDVTYESSEPSVGPVSPEGGVKAVGEGSASVTAQTGDVTLVCSVTVHTLQYMYSLNYGAAILGVGAELALKPSVQPIKEFAAAYESSDAAVASVSADGTVRGVSEGVAVITADVGDTVLTCEVSVSAQASHYAYALSDRSLDLYEGAEQKLTLTVLPEKQADVSFRSSDPSVAAVDEEGNVTAVAEGRTQIYAEADGQRFVCEVNVRAMYVLNYRSAELAAGDTLQLAVTNAIDGSDVSGVRYESSGSAVSVSENGLVTALSQGTAVVTAQTDGRTLVCVVTVMAEEEG